jgi:hypothetical protein
MLSSAKVNWEEQRACEHITAEGEGGGFRGRSSAQASSENAHRIVGFPRCSSCSTAGSVLAHHRIGLAQDGRGAEVVLLGVVGVRRRTAGWRLRLVKTT